MDNNAQATCAAALTQPASPPTMKKCGAGGPAAQAACSEKYPGIGARFIDHGGLGMEDTQTWSGKPLAPLSVFVSAHPYLLRQNRGRALDFCSPTTEPALMFRLLMLEY